MVTGNVTGQRPPSQVCACHGYLALAFSAGSNNFASRNARSSTLGSRSLPVLIQSSAYRHLARRGRHSP